MNHFETVHTHIQGLMKKIDKPAEGKFPAPYLTVTAGSFYSACIFGWDNHHMSLRFAASGKPEYLKYYLINMLEFQTSDGFVPNCPSAADGGTGCGKEFHAQPFLCQNAALYLAATGDRIFSETILQKLEKYLNYWFHFSAAPLGLFRWHTAYMSGFDNEIAGTIFPPCSILPPDLPSWLYLETKALAYLKKQCGKESADLEKKAKEIADAVNKNLWDEEYGVYSARNLASGKIQTAWSDGFLAGETGRFAYVSCPALIPLFAGIAPADRAARMIRDYVLSPNHFRSRFGIRSLSKSSEYYNNARWGNPPRWEAPERLTNSNWQGPVWVPLTWFAFHGLLRYGFRKEASDLADDLIHTLADCIEKYGFMRENFNAETGDPLYADDFASWNILADLMPDYASGRKMLDLFPWEKR